jgi:hypothetical protein
VTDRKDSRLFGLNTVNDLIPALNDLSDVAPVDLGDNVSRFGELLQPFDRAKKLYGK